MSFVIIEIVFLQMLKLYQDKKKLRTKSIALINQVIES